MAKSKPSSRRSGNPAVRAAAQSPTPPRSTLPLGTKIMLVTTGAALTWLAIWTGALLTGGLTALGLAIFLAFALSGLALTAYGMGAWARRQPGRQHLRKAVVVLLALALALGMAAAFATAQASTPAKQDASRPAVRF